MRLVKFTDTDCNVVFINPECVETVGPVGNTGNTEIQLMFGRIIIVPEGMNLVVFRITNGMTYRKDGDR